MRITLTFQEEELQRAPLLSMIRLSTTPPKLWHPTETRPVKTRSGAKQKSFRWSQSSLLVNKEVSKVGAIEKMEALFIEYNSKWVWQSEEKITLRQIGLSRTFLKPGHSYLCEELHTELGPDRKL